MLGCHDLGDKKGKRRRNRRRNSFFEEEEESYDFNVTVNKHARGMNVEEFQIKKSNVQKFYTLSGHALKTNNLFIFCEFLFYYIGGETVEMRFQYHPEAQDRDRRIMCFVWCNGDMKRTPPLKVRVEPKKPQERPEVDVLVQQLVRTKLAHLYL